MNAERQLAYDFLDLFYDEQISVLLGLDLVSPDDLIMEDTDLFKKAFKKAHNTKTVNELREAVDAKFNSRQERIKDRK